MQKLRPTSNRYFAGIRTHKQHSKLWQDLINQCPPEDRKILAESTRILDFDEAERSVYMCFPDWVYPRVDRVTLRLIPQLLQEALETQNLTILHSSPLPFWATKSESLCPRCGSRGILWQKLPKGFTKCHKYRAVCEECNMWKSWIGQKQIESLPSLGIEPYYACWFDIPESGWIVVHHLHFYTRAIKVTPPPA